MKKRLTLLLLTVSLLGIGTALFLTAFSLPTNCGGNSVVLANIRTIALVPFVHAMDSPESPFRFTSLTDSTRNVLEYYAHHPPFRTTRILVTTSPILERGKQPPFIIAVCDTPFRNVPQRRFGLAPPTHAAAYSDGTIALISPTEFAALDGSTFMPLDELIPPKSK